MVELRPGTETRAGIALYVIHNGCLSCDSYQLFRSVVPGEGRSYGLGLTVHISDYFWNDLKQHKPIPVDLRIVAGLKYSAFALDIYFWLAYRFYNHAADGIFIPSQNLQNQFGTAGADVHSFMRHFAAQLQMISIFMDDDFSYTVSDKGIRIFHISFPKINHSGSKTESVNKPTDKNNSHVNN